jgi:hypothetical protein
MYTNYNTNIQFWWNLPISLTFLDIYEWEAHDNFAKHIYSNIILQNNLGQILQN